MGFTTGSKQRILNAIANYHAVVAANTPSIQTITSVMPMNLAPALVPAMIQHHILEVSPNSTTNQVPIQVADIDLGNTFDAKTDVAKCENLVENPRLVNSSRLIQNGPQRIGLQASMYALKK